MKNMKLADLKKLNESFDQGGVELISNRINGLNIFKVLKVGEFEIRHSNLLAWMFSPKESHGMGCEFLKGVLKDLLSRTCKNNAISEWNSLFGEIDFDSCVVRREDEHQDVKLEFPKNKILIVIENKWNAAEGNGQLRRYRASVQKDGRYRGWRHIFVYLTLWGVKPTGVEDAATWMTLSYESIFKVLEACVQSLKNRKDVRVEVHAILKQYLDIVGEKVYMLDKETESVVDEIIQMYGREIDFLHQFGNRTFYAVRERIRAHGLQIGPNGGAVIPDNTETFMQFCQRFPDSSPASAHYELVAVEKDPYVISVEFHNEARCNRRDEVSQVIMDVGQSTANLNLEGISQCCEQKWRVKGKNTYIAGCVQCRGRTVDDVIHDVTLLMQKLMDLFEPKFRVLT